MEHSLLRTYVAAVMALAAGLSTWLGNAYPLDAATTWIGILMWALAVGPQTVAFPKQRVHITMSDCFIFYGMIVHGPMGAISAAFIGTLGAMQLGQTKRKPLQAAFNLGAVPLAAALAALSFETLRTQASLPVRVFAAAAVFGVINTLLVTLVLKLEGKPGLRSMLSGAAIAFAASVLLTAAAGMLLAKLSERGSGSWAVAGIVIVCFVAGKILSTIPDRSDVEAAA